ncbi:MAG: TonB family protein [Marinilabiliaceae bacterium]|nr:TonB family protein [Marinilabiliaceae bacterium]
MKEKDYKKQGVVGTIVYHAIILILLIVFGMQSIPEEEEGLLVNFGDSQTGMGLTEPRQSAAQNVSQAEQTPPPPPKSESATSKSNNEDVNTQDFEEAAALKARKKKEAQVKAENEKKRQQEIEAKKQRDEEARKVREAQEAEKKRQEELARQKAEAQNRVKNAFGSNTGSGSTSEGETKGTGNQGYVTGDPNSRNRTGSGQGTTGNGYSLSGRSLRGSLPKPAYTIQEEGIVVIEISVDNNGNVVNATPILKGTTTQNSVLWQQAKAAALKAKFNADPDAPSVQKGTITYHFVLN